MQFSDDNFDMMLSAAWSAFESTLLTWGMDCDKISTFKYYIDKYGVEDCVEHFLLESSQGRIDEILAE